MDEDINGTPEYNKIHAGLAVDAMSKAVTTAMTELAATYRWLLATLVSVNGGGIIAILSANDIFKNEAILFSTGLFVLGIVLAISTALWSAWRSGPALSLIGEAIGYWSLVRADGIREASDEASLNLKIAANERAINRRISLGTTSLVAFLAGIIVAMCGLI